MTALIPALPAPTRSSSSSSTGAAATDGIDFARELAGAERDASARTDVQRESATSRAASERADAGLTRAARNRAEAIRDRADAAQDRADASRDRADDARSRAADRADDAARADRVDRDRTERTGADTDAVDPAAEQETEGADAAAEEAQGEQGRPRETAPNGAIPEATPAGAQSDHEPVVHDDGVDQAAVAQPGSQAEAPDFLPAGASTDALTAAAQAAATRTGDGAVDAETGTEADADASTRIVPSAPEGDAAPAPLADAEGDSSHGSADTTPRQRPAEQASAADRAAQAAFAFVKAAGQPVADQRSAAPHAPTTSVDGTTPTALPLQAAPTAAAATTSAAAPAAAAPTPQNLATQLTPQLAQIKQLPQGEHVLTLSVNPETFGPVKVVAHITPESVSVHLFGASDASREALKGALADLRRDLAATGLQADLDLGTDQGPQGGPADQGDGLGQRRGATVASASIRLDGPQETTAPTLATSRRAGGVDLMI